MKMRMKWCPKASQNIRGIGNENRDNANQLRYWEDSSGPAETCYHSDSNERPPVKIGVKSL